MAHSQSTGTSSIKKMARDVPPEGAASSPVKRIRIEPTTATCRHSVDTSKRMHHAHDDVVATTAGLKSILPELPLEMVQDYALGWQQHVCREANIMEITGNVDGFQLVVDCKFSLDSTELVAVYHDGMVGLAVSEKQEIHVREQWKNGGNSNILECDTFGFAQHPGGEMYAFLLDGSCDFRPASSGKWKGMRILGEEEEDTFEHERFTGVGFTTDGSPVLYSENEWNEHLFGLLVFGPEDEGAHQAVQRSLHLRCNWGCLPISCDNKLVACDFDGVGGVWDLKTGEKDCSIPWVLDHDSDIAWSSDGTMIAMAVGQSTVELYRLDALMATSSSTLQGPIRITESKGTAGSGYAVVCCFASDNRSILTYCGGLKQWDVRTGLLLNDFQNTDVGHLWKITCSPDGKWIAGHGQYKIFVWHLGLLTRLSNRAEA